MKGSSQQVTDTVKRRQLKCLQAAGHLRMLADTAELMGLAVNEKEQEKLAIRFAGQLSTAVQLTQLIDYAEKAVKGKGADSGPIPNRDVVNNDSSRNDSGSGLRESVSQDSNKKA